MPRIISGSHLVTTRGADGAAEAQVANPESVEAIHNGEAFSAGVFDPILGDGASLELLIQVGDNPLHIGVTAQAGQNAQAQIFEDTTFTVAGTPVTPQNRNRTSAKVSLATVTSAPTLTLDGTLIGGGFIPGGTGPKPPSGQVESIAEWVFAPNKNYLVRVANDLVAAITAGTIALNWYEPGAA